MISVHHVFMWVVFGHSAMFENCQQRRDLKTLQIIVRMVTTQPRLPSLWKFIIVNKSQRERLASMKTWILSLKNYPREEDALLDEIPAL